MGVMIMFESEARVAFCKSGLLMRLGNRMGRFQWWSELISGMVG